MTHSESYCRGRQDYSGALYPVWRSRSLVDWILGQTSASHQIILRLFSFSWVHFLFKVNFSFCRIAAELVVLLMQLRLNFMSRNQKMNKQQSFSFIGSLNKFKYNSGSFTQEWLMILEHLLINSNEICNYINTFDNKVDFSTKRKTQDLCLFFRFIFMSL